ncbi:MAG: CDP-alcohol phosphatidyltransferase family protein [Paracoccaceae bacterium]
MDDNPNENRRPIASRNTKWAGRVTAALVERGITPNQISIASMGAAALAGGAFWAATAVPGWLAGILLLIGAAFTQGRLLCNLFDGLVAVEGGKGAPDGPFWNEFPDRVADLLILAGFGVAAGCPALGWAAGGLAVFTAYVRELGRALGLGSDFSGPMAKPHRMAAVTVGAVAQVVLWIVGIGWPLLLWVLWLIAIGTAATVARRGLRIVRGLNAA